MYDIDNIFAKILRSEIPCKKVAEGKYFLSFHDIHPRSSIHVLIVPTGHYTSAHEFAEKASTDEQVGFWQGLEETLTVLKIKETGYRLVMNIGIHGRQEVPHMHMHILGGQDVGPMVSK